MTRDRFEFDPERLILRFKDESDVCLLLSILRVGKFSDGLDSRVLLNPHLASLMNQLAESERRIDAERVDRLSDRGISAKSLVDLRQHNHHSDAYLHAVAKLIVSERESIGWLKMSAEDRREFIREIVAAPDSISASEVEKILVSTDQLLS